VHRRSDGELNKVVLHGADLVEQPERIRADGE